MIKNSNLNLFEELRYIIQLIEKKCQELPSDITSWTLMAEKYDVNSKKYQAVFDASVNPRLDYLNALKELRKKLIKQLNLVTTKSNDYHVFLKALDIQMPIETLMRKYNELNNVTQKNDMVITIGAGTIWRYGKKYFEYLLNKEKAA